MTAVWYWLSGVWRQQLEAGRAWTTTGHLVRNARRVGYLTAATGVLVSFHLALWPRFVDVSALDSSPRRWVWGLTALGMMILALVLAAYRTRRAPQGWLAFLVIASVVVFTAVRAPRSTFGQACSDYWPLILAVSAIALMLMAVPLARSTRWQAFFEPTYLIGTALAPLVAMGGVLLVQLSPIGQLKMVAWVPTATFGVLTLHYALAAVIPGPGAFAAVSLLCAGISLRALQQMTGSTTVEPQFIRLMLMGLSIALLAWVVHKRKPTAAMRVLMWAGAVLALGAVAYGLLVSR